MLSNQKKETRGRKALVERPVEKTVSIPLSIVAQVDLELFSLLEERVPHGAWSKLVVRLLQDYLKIAQKAGGV